MDTLFITILPSLIAVIGVIVAPVISEKLKYRHESKMYANKFIVENRIKSIETYLENIGRYLFFESTSTGGNSLSEAFSTIYIYAPKELWQDIEQMNQTLVDISTAHDYDRQTQLKKNARDQYLKLCRAFSITTRYFDTQKRYKPK